jgi:predicted O-linked N-acetylglucosamine transferase (SPINDLY family)
MTQKLVSTSSFTFCNFNPPFQLDHRVFDTWLNILKEVPDSILWLEGHPSKTADILGNWNHNFPLLPPSSSSSF